MRVFAVADTHIALLQVLNTRTNLVYNAHELVT